MLHPTQQPSQLNQSKKKASVQQTCVSCGADIQIIVKFIFRDSQTEVGHWQECYINYNNGYWLTHYIATS